MSAGFAILFNGKAAADLEANLTELQVEENLDLPGAFQLTLPVTRTDKGDVDMPSDPRLAPLTNVAVVANAEDGKNHCLIDGFILSQTAHMDTGLSSSQVTVWGQDATWLMNLEELAKEWVDVSDGQVANSIFDKYGVRPADANLKDDQTSHAEDGRTLMQRASDGQFLRSLARRNGKIFRVYCDDKPGQRIGWFAKPALDRDPDVTLSLGHNACGDSQTASVSAVDITWDVARPNAAVSRQAMFNDSDADGAGGKVDDSGLKPMDDRGLAAFTGRAVTSLLTVTVDTAGELTQRTRSMLREAGWFVTCKGTVDAARLGSILRAGMVAHLDAAGAAHSGKYLVWSVRHRFNGVRHTMEFILKRNAVGKASGGQGGGLAA
jgi:hypothetical protein